MVESKAPIKNVEKKFDKSKLTPEEYNKLIHKEVKDEKKDVCD